MGNGGGLQIDVCSFLGAGLTTTLRGGWVAEVAERGVPVGELPEK
jgi:hypothetical protein